MKLSAIFIFGFLSLSALAQPQYNNVADMLSAVQNPVVLRRATTLRTLGYNGLSDGINPLDWSWDSTNTLSTNRFRLQVGTNATGRLTHEWDGNATVFGVRMNDGLDDSAGSGFKVLKVAN